MSTQTARARMVNSFAAAYGVSKDMALKTRNKLIEITSKAVTAGQITMFEAMIMKKAYDQGLGIKEAQGQ